jgi:hypothetical protein
MKAFRHPGNEQQLVGSPRERRTPSLLLINEEALPPR